MGETRLVIKLTKSIHILVPKKLGRNRHLIRCDSSCVASSVGESSDSRRTIRACMPSLTLVRCCDFAYDGRSVLLSPLSFGMQDRFFNSCFFCLEGVLSSRLTS